MSNEPTRIELSEQHNNEAVEASDEAHSPLGRAMTRLESRITPLVVIAIIAVLIGLLLPAVQTVREVAR